MKLLLAAALALALPLAACAAKPPPGDMAGVLPPAPPPGTRLASADCFRSADIRNHTIGDSRTLFLSVRNRDVYRVGMSGACLAGAFPSDFLVTRQPPGSSLICAPIDMDVAISKGTSGGFETPCIVESIVKLTPAQVAALPPKLRP